MECLWNKTNSSSTQFGLAIKPIEFNYDQYLYRYQVQFVHVDNIDSIVIGTARRCRELR